LQYFYEKISVIFYENHSITLHNHFVSIEYAFLVVLSSTFSFFSANCCEIVTVHLPSRGVFKRFLRENSKTAMHEIAVFAISVHLSLVWREQKRWIRINREIEVTVWKLES